MSAVPSSTEVMDVFESLGPPGTPFTTTEVAEKFECTDRTIYNRLDTLVEDDKLETKKVGARGRVWWRSVDELAGSEIQYAGNGSLHTVLESRIDQLYERNIGVYTLDTELRFTYCNEQAETWLDITEAQLHGDFVWDAFEYVDVADDAYHEALDSGGPTSYLNYDESLEGWFENRVYPTNSGLTVYFTDVTAQKEAELELRERKQRSAEKYRTLFESIDEGFWIIEMLFDEESEASDEALERSGGAADHPDPVDYRFLETNSVFEEITGLTDVEGDRMRDLKPEHEDHWFEIYGRVALTGESERFTEQVEHLGDRWYDLYAFRIGEPDERKVAVLFDDISERKRAEHDLERARDLLAKTERIADVAGWELDPKTKEVHWTDHLFNLLDISGSEELSLEEIYEVYHEDDRPIVDDAINAALESGEPFDIEARYQPNGGGELHWLKIQGEPDIVNGEVATLRGAVQDITERKHREEDLRETAEKLEVATVAGEVGLWTRDMETDIVSGDAFLAETYGMDPEEVAAGAPLEEFFQPVHEEDRDCVWEAIERANEETDKMAVEYRVQDAEGNWRWAEARAKMEYDEHGEQIRLNGTMIDITDRKQREQLLDEQTDLLERIASDVPREDCFSALCAAVPRLGSGIRASIMLADDDRESFDRPIAPDLQPSWGDELENAPINDLMIGTCGEAVFQGDPVTCEDVATDDRWSEEWRELCLANDVHAGHSEPIPDADGEPVGLFMLCFDQPRTPTEWEHRLADFGTHIAGIAVERDRSRRALKESEAELAAELEATHELQEISTELIQEDDVKSLSNRVLDAIVDLMDADCASVQLYDPDRNDLELTAHRGLNEAAESAWNQVTLEERTSCAKALETGERVVVEDVETCEFLTGTEDREIYLNNGIQAVQTTPLVSRGEDVLGMFSTHWETIHNPSERDLVRLDILARQAADLIERQRTMDALRESEATFKRLNTAGRELIEATPDEIRDRTARLTKRVLDVEYATLWRYDETSGELRETTTSTDPGTDTGPIRTPNGGTDHTWQTFIGGDITVDNDLTADERDGAQLRSRILVPLGRHGVICAGSLRSHTFDEQAIDLAETLGTTIEAAWDRAESEQELACQNDELERLDELNGLIRELDQALVHADTREEIERTVCERLASSPSYEFVWFGEYDVSTDAIDPRKWAGLDSTSLADLAMPADDRSDYPAMEAIQRRTVQVVEDIATDARAAPWREGALEQGGRSCICIPLLYDESVYGVLAVYGKNPRPDDREVEVLLEFGATIAHAINAIETKSTLRSDSVVELTLHATETEMKSPLIRLAREAECEITVEGVVPGTDFDATVFFTVSEGTPDDLAAVGEDILAIRDLTCLTDRDNDEALFRAQLPESELEALLDTQGAALRSMMIGMDSVTVVVDLARADDVREFVTKLQGSYPGLELLSRKTRNRPLETRYTLPQRIADVLSPRQFEVLQTAYRSGYYEMPRIQTGANLAEMLDISPSTFALHIREAERKSFDLLFDR